MVCVHIWLRLATDYHDCYLLHASGHLSVREWGSARLTTKIALSFQLRLGCYEEETDEEDKGPKIVLPDKVDVSVIEDVLNLNKQCMNELGKVDSYTFNIFTLKE